MRSPDHQRPSARRVFERAVGDLDTESHDGSRVTVRNQYPEVLVSVGHASLVPKPDASRCQQHAEFLGRTALSRNDRLHVAHAPTEGEQQNTAVSIQNVGVFLSQTNRGTRSVRRRDM